MKVNTDSYKSFIGREVSSKPENQALILLVLFVFNLLAFGFFGIYNGYKSYREKSALQKEYQSIEANLKNNQQTILSFEPYINDNRGLEFISNAVPANTNNSEFLSELAEVYAENGFKLDRMSIGEKDNREEILVSTRGEGRFVDIPNLLHDLENMTRLVRIQEVKTQLSRSSDTVNVTVDIEMEIYKLDI